MGIPTSESMNCPPILLIGEIWHQLWFTVYKLLCYISNYYLYVIISLILKLNQVGQTKIVFVNRFRMFQLLNLFFSVKIIMLELSQFVINMPVY